MAAPLLIPYLSFEYKKDKFPYAFGIMQYTETRILNYTYFLLKAADIICRMQQLNKKIFRIKQLQ